VPPQKTQTNAKKKNGNAGGASMYLLGPSRSSFRPKILESTLLAKGCFLLFCQFLIYNGDNELPASIYRLFGPFLSLFGPFSPFFYLENRLVWFLSFLWDVTIRVTLGIGKLFESWVIFKGLLVKCHVSNFVHVR
jgi:hypothetical protein